MDELEQRTTDPELPAGDEIREQDKPMLLLAYLPVLCAIPYFVARDRPYVRWHARQGIALTAAWLAYWLASGLVIFLGSFIKLGFLLSTFSCLGHVGFLILIGTAIGRAFEPSRWRIPYLADIADRVWPG